MPRGRDARVARRVLICFVLWPAMASAQIPEFTEQEFRVAFRMVMPEYEADNEAREWASPTSAIGPAVEGGGLPYRPVETSSLSEDMLALLSLVSPETQEKVNRYRTQMRGTTAPDEKDRKQWEDRVSRIRAWVAAGAPRLPETDELD